MIITRCTATFTPENNPNIEFKKNEYYIFTTTPAWTNVLTYFYEGTYWRLEIETLIKYFTQVTF